MTVERVEAFLEGVQRLLSRSSEVRLARNEEADRKDDKIWLWVKTAVSRDSFCNHLSGMVEVC